MQLLSVSGDVFLERNEELGRPTFVSPLFYELHRSLPELLISNPAARKQEGSRELPTPTETTLSIHSSTPVLRSSLPRTQKGILSV